MSSNNENRLRVLITDLEETVSSILVPVTNIHIIERYLLDLRRLLFAVVICSLISFSFTLYSNFNDVKFCGGNQKPAINPLVGDSSAILVRFNDSYGRALLPIPTPGPVSNLQNFYPTFVPTVRYTPYLNYHNSCFMKDGVFIYHTPTNGTGEGAVGGLVAYAYCTSTAYTPQNFYAYFLGTNNAHIYNSADRLSNCCPDRDAFPSELNSGLSFCISDITLVDRTNNDCIYSVDASYPKNTINRFLYGVPYTFNCHQLLRPSLICTFHKE